MAVITTSLIPDISTSGVFTLTAPFNSLLTANASYTCLAVRQLEDIIASGNDPYQMYYVPQGISQDQYNSDLALGVCIVTLQASSGAVVYIPSSYIASYPSKGGVPYTNLMLAVDLGAMPNYVDLTYLKQQITDLVKTTIGLTDVLIQTVVVSPTTNISAADHAVAEAARRANITNTVTPGAQVIALTAQLEAMQLAYANLEAFLQANAAKIAGNPTPAPPVDQIDSTVAPAGMTLSASNLAATSTVAGWQSARGTVGQTVGQFYAEATVTALVGAVAFGICNAAQLNTSEVGSDTNGISIFTVAGGASSGIVHNGTVLQAVGAAPIQGQTLGIAVNLTTKLIWLYNPATQQWNGDVITNQNPATGLGGLPLTSVVLPSGTVEPCYLALSLDAIGDAVTLNAGASTFVNTPPTGFNPWNTAS
jgi:hypothetical protein